MKGAASFGSRGALAVFGDDAGSGGAASTKQPPGCKISVTWRDASQRPTTADFDHVVNCTGLDPMFGAADNPFLMDLMRQGILRGAWRVDAFHLRLPDSALLSKRRNVGHSM